MRRKLIVLKEATLNIEKVLHLTNEKSTMQITDLKSGNPKSLLPMPTKVDTLSEEKCGLDSKCRQNTNSSNRDASTSKTLTTQQIVVTVNWFNVECGYEFIT